MSPFLFLWGKSCSSASYCIWERWFRKFYISMCEPGYSGLLWSYFLSVLISPFNIIYYFGATSQRILNKFNASLCNHCLSFGFHERWDHVAPVFLCEGRKDCEEDLHNSHWLWSVHPCFIRRHTFGMVKRDEFVGLDVVDQGWHCLIRCYFLSSCALWGIDRKFSDVWTDLAGQGWCESR